MEIVLPLINNIGLLALAALVYTATPRIGDGISPFARSLILGLGLGGASALVMLIPIEFAPGVFFDTRGGPLLLSGILGGPVTALVAALPPLLMRIWIGGIGMVPGLIGIVIVTGCSVVAWSIIQRHRFERVFLPLLVYAAVSSLFTLPPVLLIPDPDLVWRILSTFSPIVVLTNVAGVAILGLLISVEMHRRRLVTSLKESEAAAREALAVRNRFIAMMSHEVRTPLNAILGYAQLLRDDTPDGKQADRVSRLSTSAKSLLRLIDDILHISQYQAGPVETVTERGSLPGIIDDALADIRSEAERKDLDLRIAKPGIPAVVIETDISRLRRSLINVLSNAVKFTEHGHVVIAATISTTENGEALRITVADSGIGIGSDSPDQIFEPFERLGATAIPGSGLGMAIVQAATQAMGGSVSVTSTRGVGTTVTLDIPTTTHGPPAAPSPAPGPDVSYAAARDGVRVLVVDDVQINAEIACSFLEQVGCATATAATGAEAVQAVRESRFDAVLMDIEMPVMDGLEATRTVRGPSTDEPARSVPIIALTAYASRADMIACLDAGMNGYLTKPIDRSAFYAALERVGVLRAISPDGAESSHPAPPTVDHDTPPFSEERYAALAKLVPQDTLQMVLHHAGEEIESLGAQIAAPTVSLEDKRQALHKLVSIAGNIGLLKLSSLSRAYQETIRGGGTLVDADTAEISALVSHALAKVSELQSPSHSRPEPNAD
ncbi:MAG: response regulator [Thalassobaculaceae bacterium]|nr:response regulator [Thalassobaculaceae bacterium]